MGLMLAISLIVRTKYDDFYPKKGNNAFSLWPFYFCICRFISSFVEGVLHTNYDTLNDSWQLDWIYQVFDTI
jgi:hypothetical protein